MMKLKKLESWLQQVDGFDEPNILLEQYETPAHIAARIVHTAESSFGDIKNKHIADLGAGCGMLSIGATLLDAGFVSAFDIDENALEICRQNLEDMEIANVDLIQLDVAKLTEENFSQKFDTVLLNPPFGTKQNQGIDMKFLKVALDLSNTAVYSLHKTCTRDHIIKKGNEWNVDVQVIAELRYNLPKTYKFHKKKSVDIEVDFIRFCHK